MTVMRGKRENWVPDNHLCIKITSFSPTHLTTEAHPAELTPNEWRTLAQRKRGGGLSGQPLRSALVYMNSAIRDDVSIEEHSD